MKRPVSLSEAEKLLLEQSDELDSLFFDLGPELPSAPGFNTVPVGDRPSTRAECFSGPRPCPWITCRHHLLLDVRNDGVVRVNFPDGPESMLATCALDMADDGPRTLDQVSILMGMSRERIRQIEEQALVKLRYEIRRDDMGYEGTETEAQDAALVREEFAARQESIETQRRKAARIATREARQESRRLDSIERAALLEGIDLPLPR